MYHKAGKFKQIQLYIHFIMQKVEKRGAVKVYCRFSGNYISLHVPKYPEHRKHKILSIRMCTDLFIKDTRARCVKP